MDKDIQRKQIFDELQAEFGTKLREAKRQKSQVEEELESLSEKWRSERRKLNSEIDRLESSLTEANETRKKSRDVRAQGIDPLEVAKIQASADEQIKAAAKAWDNQRVHLQTEISRLEHAVADTLERSNNPLRVTAGIKLRLETQLEEALQIKRNLEEESVKAKDSWDKEKLHLTGEIIKARHEAVKPVKGSEEDGHRIADLENRIGEANRIREGLQLDLQRAHDDWLSERKKLVTDFDLVRNRAQETQLHDKGHREDLELQLRQASAARDAFEGDLSKARGDWESERRTFVTELDQAQQTQLQDKGHTEDLAQQLRDASTARDAFERDLSNAHTDWQSERQTFVTELDHVRTQAEQTQLQDKSHIEDLAQQLKDASTARDAFECDLGNARTDWQSERQALVTELDQVRTQAEQTQLQDKSHIEDLAQQLKDASTARDAFERDLGNARTDWQSERQALVTEIDQARSQGQETQLQDKGHTADLGQQLKDASTARDSFERDLTNARTDWQSERQALVTELDQARSQGQETQLQDKQRFEDLVQRLKETSDTRDGFEHDLGKARTELTHARSQNQQAETQLTENAMYGDQLREAMQQRNVLQYEVESARDSIRAIRDEHAGERSRVEEEASVLSLRIQHLEAMNSRLTEDLNNAGVLRETEKDGGADDVPSDKLNAELARVRALIADLARIIDDPNTELSTVIRKNVERVELDAYLRGVLFSMGRTVAGY